jgi:DNA mismatch endonuclease (patch repair protein)
VIEAVSSSRAISQSIQPTGAEIQPGAPELRAARAGYPVPTTALASAIMRANPSRNTGPERRLRQALHARGLRYRVNYSIRVDGGRPISVDIAFTGAKLAVFVDGCFWHSCPEHGSVPKTNRHYWPSKFRRNVERDEETTRRLRLAGWNVARFWEHQDRSEVVSRIICLVKG